jgi:hypothetical protein
MPHLLVLAALVGSAEANDFYTSEVVTLPFFAEYDAFAAANVDTGNVPAGSPVAVRFYIKSRGGSYAEFETESHLEWPSALTQRLEGVPGSGYLQVIGDLEMAAQVTWDIWDFRGGYNIWEDRLKVMGEREFNPNLLPGDGNATVQIEARGGGFFRPWTTSVNITVLELRFTLQVFPRVRNVLTGRRFETNGYDTVSSQQTIRHEVPTHDPGVLELETFFEADNRAVLDVVVQPSIQICAPLFGCFSVATFDLPIGIVDRTVLQTFPSIAYEHPLPSLVAPMTVFDFGDLHVSTLRNLQLPLTNQGQLPLEGTLSIEGDPSFSVFPPYFFATEGNTAGAVVTFDPTSEGLKTATLLLSSNDPRQPDLRIPLAGLAWDGDGEELTERERRRLSGEVRGCGCDSTAPVGLSWLGLGLGTIALLRRRRRA